MLSIKAKNNVKRGNVYVVNLKGADPDFRGYFPVLILQNNEGNKHCDFTFGVPIHISEKKGASYIPISAKDLHTNSKIFCNKLICFRRKRIKRFLFTLDRNRMKCVEKFFIKHAGLHGLPQ